jgi:hypothetical protein
MEKAMSGRRASTSYRKTAEKDLETTIKEWGVYAPFSISDKQNHGRSALHRAFITPTRPHAETPIRRP